MEDTKIEMECNEKLVAGLEQTKSIIAKQVSSFGRLLSGKILENYSDVNQELLQELLLKEFNAPICKELDHLFKYYKKQELEFYNKNLKTTDLIFNTLKDRRTQTIYLNNIIKKINEKEENIQEVFKTSAQDRLNPDNEKKEDSLNVIFGKFLKKLINMSHVSIEQSEELYDLALHYYKMFQMDVASALGQYFSGNKEITISKIEKEMDKRKIRNGKTAELSKIERSITAESINVMENMLEKNVLKHKIYAKAKLESCSKSMVDLFFKLLPPKYQDQKELIDIIVDTNINERLGKIIDKETEKLSSNLSFMNKDIIENELYEEKRYQKIEDYHCDFGLLNVVYQDVLHEICIAYNIEENDQNTKRLKVVLLSEEANYPKTIFNNCFEKIKQENKQNLNSIILEMHSLSEKASKEKEPELINSQEQKK